MFNFFSTLTPLAVRAPAYISASRTLSGKLADPTMMLLALAVAVAVAPPEARGSPVPDPEPHALRLSIATERVMPRAILVRFIRILFLVGV
jgi:hypothetical protein